MQKNKLLLMKPLAIAVLFYNLVFRLDLELKDHEGSTALWLALQYITVASDPSINPFEDDAPVVNGTSFDENSFAARLIQRGSNPDAPDASGILQEIEHFMQIGSNRKKTFVAISALQAPFRIITNRDRSALT